MRRLAYAIGVLVVGACAGYLFTYLYRWEWQRALLAGVLLVAAELALVAALVLERLGRLEGQLRRSRPDRPPPGRDRAVGRRLQQGAPPPRLRFAWLERDPDALAVFIPVLLGAGMLVSALAWLLEWAAHRTARPAAERGLAGPLASLAPPLGNPLAGDTRPALPPRRPWRAGWLLAVALAAALLVGGLARLTQNRPDPPQPAQAATLVLQVAHRQDPQRAGTLAASVWQRCVTSVLGAGATATGLLALGQGRYAVLLRPAPGPIATRQLRGCLQDATTDQLQLQAVTVTGVEQPAATAPSLPSAATGPAPGAHR
jgi:hypothetical protein